MWTKILQGADQATIGEAWPEILDAWAVLESSGGRKLLTDKSRVAALAGNCAKILRVGFSPSAVALEALCDLTLYGFKAFAARLVTLRDFALQRPDALDLKGLLVGDDTDRLRALLGNRFVLGRMASLELQSAKNVAVGNGVVTPDPKSALEDYYTKGDLYSFELKDATTDDYSDVITRVRELQACLTALKQQGFVTKAFYSVLAVIEHQLRTRVPEEPQRSEEVTEVVVESDTRTYNFAAMIDECRDIFLRPYLESAHSLYELETISLSGALARATLLPPALENIGPLLNFSSFERAASSPVTPLRVKRGAGIESILGELERQRSHRMAQAMLRRAVEVAAMDDADRIKALAEDRARWRRVVEVSVTSARTLDEKLLALVKQWRSCDPSCPVLPYIEAARMELTRTHPVSEDEISRALLGVVASVPQDKAGVGPTGASTESSTWALMNDLSALTALSQMVTGNPIPSIYLQRALAALRGSDAKVSSDVG